MAYGRAMSHIVWPKNREFRTLTLKPRLRTCAHCGGLAHFKTDKHRRLHSLEGPTHVISKVACCADKQCPGHTERIAPRVEEMSIAPPYWTVSWDLFAWMGHRRFSRHWSVPQIRTELEDSYSITAEFAGSATQNVACSLADTMEKWLTFRRRRLPRLHRNSAPPRPRWPQVHESQSHGGRPRSRRVLLILPLIKALCCYHQKLEQSLCQHLIRRNQLPLHLVQKRSFSTIAQPYAAFSTTTVVVR